MTKPSPSLKVLSLTAVFLAFSLACRLSNPLNPPTETPLPTPTSTPQRPVLPISVPDELILIVDPAPNSRLVSPLTVGGTSGPTFEQNLVVSLTSPDGSQIALGSVTIQADIGEAGLYSLSLPFSLDAETVARLSVYDVSARDGGLVHLNSRVITLLPGGESEVPLASLPIKEAIHIERPMHMEAVSGGALHASGFSDYFFEGTLNIALCGPGGSGTAHLVCGTGDNLLVEGLAVITSPDVGQPGPFSLDLVYQVTESTPARLVVYAISPMDGAIEHLASQEIVLNP